MKRFITVLCCFALLLLCGCGGQASAKARTLPDVRILDAVPSADTGEAPSPSPDRTAKPAPAQKPTAEPPAAPPSQPIPEPTAEPDVAPDPARCPYVGSRNSEIYHLAGCSQAGRIKAENLLGWASAEEAEAAGRSPCKACLSEKPEKTPEPVSTPAPTPTPTPAPTETPIPVVTPEPTKEAQPERAGLGGYAYVGSRNSEIYHLAGCSQAERIKAENLLGWASAEEAEAAGRSPCKACLSEKTEKTPEPEETVIPVSTPEPEGNAEPEERAVIGEYAYVGSRKSDKYHLPSCRYAQSIDGENLVGWATAAEAEAAGYRACKVCKP